MNELLFCVLNFVFAIFSFACVFAILVLSLSVKVFADGRVATELNNILDNIIDLVAEVINND